MAATRISGICFGVICSVTLSVLIFPKSANCEAVDSMAHALLDLSAFHALAWTGGRSEALPGGQLPPDCPLRLRGRCPACRACLSSVN